MRNSIFQISPLILIFFLIFSCSCNKKQSPIDHPIHQLKSYSFNPGTSLISRVQKTPGFVIDYLRKLDSRDNYTVYTPDKNELNVINQYMKGLPALTKKVLKNRLIGIYFINNFWGSGLAEWAMDTNGNVFAFIVCNSKVLKSDISDWITFRENSCFKADNPDITIKIDCGRKFNGFIYALLHESAHVVDYVERITPYVEEFFRARGKSVSNETVFTRGIWKGLRKPVKRYDYSYRKSITFYGFNKGPKINISESVKVYRELSGTPLVSLYGSMSWAEDLAEYIFFHHLTQKLRQPYRINVYNKKKLIFSYEPMKSKAVLERASAIGKFYR